MVIGLLRSPFHRLASGSLVLITYRGRESGRHITTPVVYAVRDGAQTVFVSHPERKTWWRNLLGGAEVDVQLRGRLLHGRADVVSDAAAVEAHLDRYPRARNAVEAADSSVFVRVDALAP